MDRKTIASTALLVITAISCAAPRPSLPARQETKEQPILNPAPTAQDWADLTKLPDWSGVWNPNITDQFAQMKTNPPPWTPKAAEQVARMFAEEKAGRPPPVFVNCLPEAMPSWMLVTHNALEILFTPGRVTMLGESDGNRLRRIYTDGRPHPQDLDATFHGHSIGHWEGQTLVVDTVGVVPQAYLAISEAVGIPNNGELHVVERIHLAGPDLLHDELEITDPKILTKPWKTTRAWFRQRARKYDIVEGVCLEGSFKQVVDADGNAVYLPIQYEVGGNRVPPQ